MKEGNIASNIVIKNNSRLCGGSLASHNVMKSSKIGGSLASVNVSNKVRKCGGSLASHNVMKSSKIGGGRKKKRSSKSKRKRTGKKRKSNKKKSSKSSKKKKSTKKKRISKRKMKGGTTPSRMILLEIGKKVPDIFFDFMNLTQNNFKMSGTSESYDITYTGEIDNGIIGDCIISVTNNKINKIIIRNLEQTSVKDNNNIVAFYLSVSLNFSSSTFEEFKTKHHNK